MGAHFLRQDDGKLNAVAQIAIDGRLGLKLGKFGALVGCSNILSKFTCQLINQNDGEDNETPVTDKNFGSDPETELPVFLRNGRTLCSGW